jgi:hypothetical protein
LQGWRGFRKVKTVVRGVQKHFTAQNTNTWLRTGVGIPRNTSGKFCQGYFEKPGPQKTWLRNSLRWAFLAGT